jgi:hypothetical protein
MIKIAGYPNHEKLVPLKISIIKTDKNGAEEIKKVEVNVFNQDHVKQDKKSRNTKILLPALTTSNKKSVRSPQHDVDRVLQHTSSV